MKPFYFFALFLMLFVSLDAGAAEKCSAVVSRDVKSFADLKKIGLKPVVRKIEPVKLKALSESEDRYTLDVQLGRISEAQFKILRAQFGNTSEVKFLPEKSFNLIDFLPPLAQAVVNKTFKSTHYDMEKLRELAPPENSSAEKLEEWEVFTQPFFQNGLEFFTNCWNTSIEVMKALQNPLLRKYSIGWPDRWSADNLIRGDEFAVKISEEDARAGDMIVFSRGNPDDKVFSEIQHTAIILSQDLVFEKTNSSAIDPFRISYRQDVIAKYKRLFKGEFIVEFVRFAGTKPKLVFEISKMDLTKKEKALIKKANPNVPVDNLTMGGETRMGGGVSPVVTEFRQVDIAIDPVTGRGVLSGDPKIVERFEPL